MAKLDDKLNNFSRPVWGAGADQFVEGYELACEAWEIPQFNQPECDQETGIKRLSRGIVLPQIRQRMITAFHEAGDARAILSTFIKDFFLDSAKDYF